MGQPTVCVYIPNLNGGDRLRRTLESLGGQSRPAPVVVVDNGSVDGSPGVAEREFGARVIRLDRNVGFGNALNLGVREHPAERLVFVNNDVECERQFLEALEEASGNETMVAGVLLQFEVSNLIDSAGVAAGTTLFAWDYLHGQPVANVSDADHRSARRGARPCSRRRLRERRRIRRADLRLPRGPRPCPAAAPRRGRLQPRAGSAGPAPAFIDSRVGVAGEEQADGLEPRVLLLRRYGILANARPLGR